MTGQVRQRRGANKKKQTKSKRVEAKARTPAAQEPAPHEEESAWTVVRSHPLAMATPVILTIYGIYLAFYYVLLQRPDLVASATFGRVQLRPPVTATDERQLLIVGSMMSGMEQVASKLSETLKLEIRHEMSDSAWNFVRDGTVSWFRGIRFLPPLELKDVVMRWSQLCGNYTGGMGFHPKLYNSAACSSHRKKWSKCWRQECLNVLNSEWGCSDSRCEPPFHTTLFHVRHPLQTMENLVTSFCTKGWNETIHSVFITYASALFPNHDYEEDNCIEASAHYLLEYNRAMIKAQSKGHIAGMYRIEETSPCEIARLAGFMNPVTTVYAPNYDRIAKICEALDSEANQFIKVDDEKTERISLKWEDLRGGMHDSKRPNGDTSLERKLRELTKALGYNPDEPYSEQTEFHN